MKTLLFLILLLVIERAAFAQEPYLWPIKDAAIGSGMICTPQEHIGEELNFDNLIIGAKEGALVVAPTDGIIERFRIGYFQSLSSSMTLRSESGSFNHILSMSQDYIAKCVNPRCWNGRVSIRVGRGKILEISGLVGDVPFKTGQRIRRGDTLGFVGYSYHKIAEPSICISMSLDEKPSDPMSPFGIKSSFIPFTEMKPKTSFTKSQAKEDFKICIDAVQEIYPGLSHVLTSAELERYVAETDAAIDSKDGDLTYREFQGIIKRTVALVHDSHISMRLPVWDKPKPLEFQPQILLGWLNDTLYCINATKEYRHLLGQRILSVNGILADTARKQALLNIDGYDAKVEEYANYCLAMNGFYPLFFNTDTTPTFDMNLELSDGRKIDVKGIDTKKGSSAYVASSWRFTNINRNNGSFVLKKISPSVAYIGLSNFAMNQVEMEEIARFIESISQVPNLIIDVRNNGGGVKEVIEKLYSYIAGKPMVLQGYSKVNKQGGFECFKYSMNFSDGSELFPDFKAEPGREGFYQYPEGGRKLVEPDSVVNYKGRVYMLANEGSASAATLFPALLVRNHRGVVVGRETRTAYHFMNADKFAIINLPNSGISVRIPLVEICFDTVVNQRVPFGRGLIPDYEVPLTLNEINYTNGDVILNYTLALIEQGKYLTKKDPFSGEESIESSVCNTFIWILSGICLAVGVFAIYVRRKKTYKMKGRK